VAIAIPSDTFSTTASVISRLEDADYEGHSLAMLNRIAGALHRRVEIRFVPIRKPRLQATHAYQIVRGGCADG